MSGDAYVVTLTGLQQTVAARVGSFRDELGCTFDFNDSDRQVLAFSARTRVRLSLRPGASLPKIHFAAVVRTAGSRHRASELTDGDVDVCNASQPPQTTTCAPRVLRGGLNLRPTGGGRLQLDGGLAGDGDRRACPTTLTKPDRFLVPSESRLTLPSRVVTGLFAKGQMHSETSTATHVVKTTDVRWTVVLKRAP